MSAPFMLKKHRKMTAAQGSPFKELLFYHRFVDISTLMPE